MFLFALQSIFFNAWAYSVFSPYALFRRQLILNFGSRCFGKSLSLPRMLYNCEASRRSKRSRGEGRRVGRVAEGGGLLNRCRTKSSTGGSNPPLSASKTNYFRMCSYLLIRGPIWPPNQAFVFLRRISAKGGERQNLRLSTHPEKGHERSFSLAALFSVVAI